MEKKINVAELLKDCPKGMKLNCTMFDNVTFVKVDNSRKQFPIEIAVSGLHSKYLTKEGCFHDTTLLPEAKCVIFPKGKTTWEGFHKPFEDGDIVVTMESINYGTWISIFKGNNENGIVTYADFCVDSNSFYQNSPTILCPNYDVITQRIATEEEKQKLFDAIKANGYRWNVETKTLEKLIEPKFKVGDRIKNKNSGICDKVIKIFEDCYLVESCLDEQATIGFDIQDNWVLAPNKFDISTLKPFDKVLTRANDNDAWVCNLYSHRMKDYYVVLNAELAKQCIPYEGNEHLLGTANDCPEYYKTW